MRLASEWSREVSNAMNENAMILCMGKVGRPVNEERRELVRAALASGKSQSQIARELGVSQPNIAKMARALGIAPKVYGKMVVRADGKRKCSRCGKFKTAGAFPTERDTICRVCFGQ